MTGDSWGGSPPPPDPQESSVAVAEPLEADIAWRLECLLRADFAADDALALALDRQIDLHYVLDLIKNGCTHDFALQIVM